jgi:hypothetical protein
MTHVSNAKALGTRFGLTVFLTSSIVACSLERYMTIADWKSLREFCVL